MEIRLPVASRNEILIRLSEADGRLVIEPLGFGNVWQMGLGGSRFEGKPNPTLGIVAWSWCR